jgi:hypothetical protein
VAEDPLDIEQVELVPTVGTDRIVEDPGGGPAQVVWGDVAEPRLLRPFRNDGKHGS